MMVSLSFCIFYIAVAIVVFGFMAGRQTFKDVGFPAVVTIALIWPVWLLYCLGVWLSIAWGDDE